jgi:hypothetical protein
MAALSSSVRPAADLSRLTVLAASSVKALSSSLRCVTSSRYLWMSSLCCSHATRACLGPHCVGGGL